MMAYSPKTWIGGVTPANSVNMNALEVAVGDASLTAETALADSVQAKADAAEALAKQSAISDYVTVTGIQVNNLTVATVNFGTLTEPIYHADSGTLLYSFYGFKVPANYKNAKVTLNAIFPPATGHAGAGHRIAKILYNGVEVAVAACTPALGYNATYDYTTANCEVNIPVSEGLIFSVTLQQTSGYTISNCIVHFSITIS